MTPFDTTPEEFAATIERYALKPKSLDEFKRVCREELASDGNDGVISISTGPDTQSYALVFEGGRYGIVEDEKAEDEEAIRYFDTLDEALDSVGFGDARDFRVYRSVDM